MRCSGGAAGGGVGVPWEGAVPMSAAAGCGVAGSPSAAGARSAASAVGAGGMGVKAAVGAAGGVVSSGRWMSWAAVASRSRSAALAAVRCHQGCPRPPAGAVCVPSGSRVTVGCPGQGPRARVNRSSGPPWLSVIPILPASVSSALVASRMVGNISSGIAWRSASMVSVPEMAIIRRRYSASASSRSAAASALSVIVIWGRAASRSVGRPSRSMSAAGMRSRPGQGRSGRRRWR